MTDRTTSNAPAMEPLPVRCGARLSLPGLVIRCGDAATETCPTCGRRLCVVCALPDGRCEACVITGVGLSAVASERSA